MLLETGTGERVGAAVGVAYRLCTIGRHEAGRAELSWRRRLRRIGVLRVGGAQLRLELAPQLAELLVNGVNLVVLPLLNGNGGARGPGT